jgi:dolichyl-phosphate beta-glucosyltransferase
MLLGAGEYLFFTDADLSVPIETLPRFLTQLENHCDVIVGTRKKAGALIEVHQPFYREFMGKTYTMLSNWILASHISDFTCGFKGFRKEAARALFSLQRLKNWSFDSEILYLAELKGYRVEEVPVTWRDDKATKVKLWRDVASSFLGLMKIRANQFSGRYD